MGPCKTAVCDCAGRSAGLRRLAVRRCAGTGARHGAAQGRWVWLRKGAVLGYARAQRVAAQGRSMGCAGAQRWAAQGTGADPGRDPTPKGGGGLRTPKLSHGTMCLVGAGYFVLGIRREKFFCSTLCVCTQNTQNFVENSKMAEKHKKGF